jgi:hypothetical protein
MLSILRLPLFVVFVLGIYFFSCTSSLESRLFSLPVAELSEKPVPANRFKPLNDCCRDYLSYTPDTNYIALLPKKYVRVNFHFMNSSDGTENFNEIEGARWAKGLVHTANNDLKNNQKLFLPYKNDLPNLPIRFLYRITPRPDDPDDDGIYFHYDDDLYYYVVKGRNRNRSKREVIKKYGIQLDTVLNIFIMPHHPDSVISPTYQPSGCGIALGNAVKIAGGFENDNPAWKLRGVFNHEVGHIYGLGHTWAYNDGCDDTPRNPKCWNQSDTPPCDTAASNNVMDYNAYQSAWSPCQIGKVHYYMSLENQKARKFLRPEWCTLHEDRHIYISDSTHFAGARDIEGHITIRDGGILKVSCRLSLPISAKLTVEPGGKLILDNCRIHNSCGDEWQGIEVQERGNRKGIVEVIGKPTIENVVLSR